MTLLFVYPPGDAPRIYEILWEPTAYFSGKPEDLVEYLKIASASLKKFAPNARLAAPTLDRLSYESTVFGSPAAGQDNFLEYTRKLFKAGMGRYLDIYSIYPGKFTQTFYSICTILQLSAAKSKNASEPGF